MFEHTDKGIAVRDMNTSFHEQISVSIPNNTQTDRINANEKTTCIESRVTARFFSTVKQNFGKLSSNG